MFGAWLARRLAHEPAPKPAGQLGRLVLTRVVQGFLVMSMALLAMGCPIRLTLRAADLPLEGGIGLAGVVVGVTAAAAWLKARA